MSATIQFDHYFCPQPELVRLDDARLLERLRAWLLDARDEKTETSVSARVTYALDSVRQIRDLLLARGHQFSAEDVAAMAAIGA